MQILKISRGLYPRTPIKGKRFGREGERRIGGEGMEIKEGGMNKGRKRRGKEE
jgi:hypothetical protein